MGYKVTSLIPGGAKFQNHGINDVMPGRPVAVFLGDYEERIPSFGPRNAAPCVVLVAACIIGVAAEVNFNHHLSP